MTQRLGCILLLLLSTLTLHSCGYSFGHGGLSERYASITIPHALGDTRGLLTTALTHEIAKTGDLKIRRTDGALLLLVELVDDRRENMGFRYATEEPDTDTLTRRLVVDEERLSVLARVTLVESATGEIVWGPQYITEFADYDLDPNSNPANILQFSMGQLAPIEVAEETAEAALYRKLATRITRGITATW